MIPGPYTSEISVHALKKHRRKIYFIGHSEVRQNMSEDDELINTKIKQAIRISIK